MRDAAKRAYVWQMQDRVTLAQAAKVMGVDTAEARRIYDEAMMERVGMRG